MNNAIRCINFCSNNYLEVPKLYNKANILQVNDLFHLEVAKFMYKLNNNQLPQYFSPLFETTHTTHNHQTKAATSNNYFVPRKNCSAGLGTLGYLGAKLWNDIPTTFKRKNCVNSFAKSYKKYIKKITHNCLSSSCLYS